MSEPKENWVTVGSFPHGADLVFIEHSLEEAGIAYFKRDETTVQLLPYLSQALGGVRLQVPATDVDRALVILKEAGIPVEERAVPSSEIGDSHQNVEGRPVIGRFTLGRRSILAVAIVAAVLAMGAQWYFAPDPATILADRHWCVTEMVHDGALVRLRSVGDFQEDNPVCQERIRFAWDGDIFLPGINSSEMIGSWWAQRDSLSIRTTNPRGQVYNGMYSFEVDGSRLILISHRTRITCLDRRSTGPSFN